MSHELQFYIDGRWVDPAVKATIDVINPATEKVFARVAAGSATDVDRAVAAARRASYNFSRTSTHYRVQLLQAILEQYKKRYDDIAEAVSKEMGAPISLAKGAQAWIGQAQGLRI